MAVQPWSADCLVSAPTPLDGDRPVVVDLGGFAWGSGGITHDLTEGDVEEMLLPTYVPALPEGS